MVLSLLVTDLQRQLLLQSPSFSSFKTWAVVLEIVYIEVTMEVMCGCIALPILLKHTLKMGALIVYKIYLSIRN